MLESAVLLKEIIKTSGPRLFLRLSNGVFWRILVWVRPISLFPAFPLITSFSQIWALDRNICPLSMNTFSARLMLIVSPVRIFMNISISNVSEDNYCFVLYRCNLLNKLEFLRMRSVILRARRSRLISSHLFFTKQLWAGWRSSAFLVSRMSLSQTLNVSPQLPCG